MGGLGQSWGNILGGLGRSWDVLEAVMEPLLGVLGPLRGILVLFSLGLYFGSDFHWILFPTKFVFICV